MTVAAANTAAVIRASTSPASEPAAHECEAMTTVPESAVAMAIHVRRGTGSPSQSHAPRAAMNGHVLWMTSVFATEVRASALMKQVDAVAKHAAMATPGQPMARSADHQP